jgi:hypothetical protein
VIPVTPQSEPEVFEVIASYGVKMAEDIFWAHMEITLITDRPVTL